MDICIDVNTRNVAIARKQCPENYHIEYTRSGYVLYVKNGYYYDMNDDICYKDGE